MRLQSVGQPLEHTVTQHHHERKEEDGTGKCEDIRLLKKKKSFFPPTELDPLKSKRRRADTCKDSSTASVNINGMILI